ncbi:hypothetical protein CYMTET_12204 [Cymbomonas tetramitiformis]|uniref:Uncharacterized protein n=1 Tax=Cymbomonas tetramitiformis TaxID=36881 RepID=A0AAE0GKR4_9CHLO|nr:hypothetical protein CYMTET_12204 [Cymbomonas tetramitiformis]
MKIALLKASDEYAIYVGKLTVAVPVLSESDKNVQSYLAALISEQRNREKVDGSAGTEDLSCKRQFDLVDKADSFFFKAKIELERLLETQVRFQEGQLTAVERMIAELVR